MFYFFRAVAASLRYRWTITASIASSALIALLWGASITTVYPLVEVIFQEQKTIPGWLDAQIETRQRRIDEGQAQIAQLQRAANPDATRLRRLQTDLRGLQRARDGLAWAAPTVRRYAPATPFATLVLVMSWLVATSALKGVLLVCDVILVSRVANRTVWDLRRSYFRRALELDQRCFDRVGTSALMAQLSHNMQQISAGLAMFYGKMIREPMKMLTCLVGAALISWKLLLISLCVIPFGAYLVHNLSRRMKRASVRENDGMASAFQTLMEAIGSIKTVRIFNRELTERVRFKRSAAALYRMSQRISLYDSILRPVSEMLGILSITLALLAGAYLVLNQETHLFGIQIFKHPMSASSLLMFYALLAGASDPARKMSEIVNVLVRGGTACEMLHKTFDQPSHAMLFDPLARIPIHQRALEFRKVTFGYQPQYPVLQQVDLTIEYRQTVAIVGGNGSGKSSLVNLLARFYDPQQGAVLLDGVDLAKLNPKKLRRQMAWVTQDSLLFRGTVRENILYGARGADEAALREAARIARVEEFIDRLPQGYDTDVGDGGCRLSAGQRQRVALARAVLANPRILILDEATSQMDVQSELLVHASLKPFLQQRTTILITHRVTSLELADRVIVLERGRIVSDSAADRIEADSASFRHLFARSA